MATAIWLSALIISKAVNPEIMQDISVWIIYAMTFIFVIYDGITLKSRLK